MSEVRQMAAGLPLPSQKFLASMLLGLLMAQSSLLSDIARRLKALTSITFHALHKRLCWSLKATRWSVMPVQERYLQQAASKLGRDRLIAVDLGDVTKPSAQKMPQITTVRDGSTGELKKGWHLLEIEALTKGKNRHIPLWLELFTIGRRRYQSVWSVIENAITQLVRQMGPAGLWVFDRGFDAWHFFRFLIQLRITFLVRVNTRRFVKDLSDGRRRSFGQIAKRVLKTAPLLWRRKFKGQALLLKVGYQIVQIPKSDQHLTLIVVEGFGKHPLLLLTNRILRSPEEAARWAKKYLKRWGVEEAGRLIKQVFRLENLRVLSWAGLVKLVWCALWAYGLVCLRCFQPKKQLAYLLDFYAGFGQTPDFPYYRLAGALSLMLLAVSSTMPTLLIGAQKSG